jgi:hypothetical protein
MVAGGWQLSCSGLMWPLQLSLLDEEGNESKVYAIEDIAQ